MAQGDDAHAAVVAGSPAVTSGGGAGGDPSNPSNEAGRRMRITIGSSVFTATLADNETVTAFKTRLPLTVEMTDLNANEKFYHSPEDLPEDASNPGTIHAGDVMLYGSNAVVLFYKTFSTSYSYTRIGKVDDTSGLAAALRPRSVTVTFSL
jgi:hypothetical protein